MCDTSILIKKFSKKNFRQKKIKKNKKEKYFEIQKSFFENFNNFFIILHIFMKPSNFDQKYTRKNNENNEFRKENH